MKKWLAILMAAALCVAGFAALAEEVGQDVSLEEEVFPTEVDQDWIVGRWTEYETQFTEMTVEKNPAAGWDVVIVSPLTHGAYIFKTTIRYDAESDRFVYDKGKYWDVPITDSDEEAELGEAKIAGTTGSFAVVPDEQMLRLTWVDDQNPDAEVIFEYADTASWVTAHEFLGEWVDQDGTCNIDITEREEGDGYIVNVQLNHASEGGSGYTVYAYACVYDEESHALKCFSRITGSGDYEPDSEEEIADADYEYADAEFYFDSADFLIWDDKGLEVDDAMAFEHTIGWVDPDYVGPGHHFAGEWNDERMSVSIEERMEDYTVIVTGSGGAFNGSIWLYTCDYDAQTDSLVSNGEVAERYDYAYDEAEEYSETCIYQDGEAVFTIDAEDRLIWDDKKENAGEGRAFARVEAD